MDGTRFKILDILIRNRDRFISGAQLSTELGVTRAAIWKHIRALQQEGISIEGVSNRGYRLMALPDRLKAEYIQPYLNTHRVGRSMVCLDETGSTNSDARALALSGCADGLTVLAESQQAGRGRRGRSWHSEQGAGIYMSVVLRPEISPALAPRFTLSAALAVCRVLKGMEIPAEIKWPNDVLCRGKKMCGILLEMGGNMEKLDYIVVGMGINANHSEYPEEIREIATSVKLELGQSTERCRLTARILDELETLADQCITDEGYRALMEEYKANSATLGKLVNVIGVNETLTGTVEDFDELGCIVLRMEDGSVRRIGSGDVSVRNA
ncbi:MAG: biotin--[Clostridia bacterium]|nr:biotin--[acetyl-CoA-carboxylase] ligase [Clostridia bacterium]